MPICSIFFWQQTITPHMAYLAEALSFKGFDCTYIANTTLSPQRQSMGWQKPDLKSINVRLSADSSQISSIIKGLPSDSIHLCEGFRGNGLVGYAFRLLAKRSLRTWIIIEGVDDHGVFGIVKRSLYKWILWRDRNRIEGILSIGYSTSDWIASRGFNPNQIFPFAYFLSATKPNRSIDRLISRDSFRFVFVGRLIERKALNLLFDALAVQDQAFELIVIGDGPMRSQWQALAELRLPSRVKWLGKLCMDEVSPWIEDSDCLVLPSLHDGWGAVVSEALMVGTPVICSDACGSAEVVRMSGFGGVFKSGDRSSLSCVLADLLLKGHLSSRDRQKLAYWAKCLNANSGAEYLQSILNYSYSDLLTLRPLPPWCLKA